MQETPPNEAIGLDGIWKNIKIFKKISICYGAP